MSSREGGNPKGTNTRSVYGDNRVLKLSLIDAGTPEIIEAADEAVLTQEGQAEVLLRLDIVAGLVKSLVSKIAGLYRGRGGIQNRQVPGQVRSG